MTTVGYMVGSLSATSMNRMLAEALAELAPAGMEFREIEIGNLPLYNRDFDADYPQAGRDLKDSLAEVDAVVIVTPEYSRSIPGALKNALDWSSRPWGTNSFAGKATAVIGMSPGGPGTAMAQQHLRNILAHFNARTMGQPEAFVQFDQEAWVNGKLQDEGLREVLTMWLGAFENHVEMVRAAELAVANA
nr:NAD(P)H-dependent oxidoreductase [Actinomycetales bacterium]